jgi:hypothetical protein
MDFLFLFLVILIIWALVQRNSHFVETGNIDDILSYQKGSSDLLFKKHIKKIDDLSTDVRLEPVGCFTDIFNKFFLRKINPFSAKKEFDSGITITNQADYDRVIEIITQNGFGDFNFPKDYKKASFKKLATLALFAGYSYISAYNGTYYFTYSPPMERYNITGNFSDSEIKEYSSKSEYPINECGFKCGDGSEYMCGSISYPNIKSASRSSVYKIIEMV